MKGIHIMSAGYPDKKPSSIPPHRVDGYNSQAAPLRPPAASKFGVGASNLTEINDAIDQRRAHSAALSRKGSRMFE
jgi:hypothetical protein